MRKSKMPITSVEEEAVEDSATVTRNASIDEIERAEAELRRLMPPAMPVTDEVTATPPPPPADIDVPEALDVWLIPIQVFSFDPTVTPERASPMALFGARDPTAGSRHSERSTSEMARWLRAQLNAPWGWVDGQTRMIVNAYARWHRETPGSRSEAAAFDFWFDLLQHFEIEIEERIRNYLTQNDKQRENAASLSRMTQSAGAPSPTEIAASYNAAPKFDPRRFVAIMERRSVRVEIDKVTHRPAFRGAAAGISPADHETITSYRHEIAGFLATAARARSAS